jgi:hypothetical protein
VKAALEAGKHVVCEKPLAMSTAEAREMVQLARATKLRNCTFHNLRYYPMVQQARRMCEAGELGDILIVQGTYSQDWLLYETDWNWRLVSAENGASRCLADIGSHWCDGVEHVTGLRISSVCADLQTFIRRKRPKKAVASFGTAAAGETEDVPIQHRRFRRGDVPHGRADARKFHCQPGERGPPRIISASNLRFQGECDVGRRTSRRIVDRTPRRAKSDQIKDPPSCCPRRDPTPTCRGHSEGYDDTFKASLPALLSQH